MPARVASFDRINYSLRPSKQVERKLLIETLHTLSRPTAQIRDYVYVGFGSPYYADFVLFHRYLYISSMICVEREAIPRRMQFNKPFPFIKLYMKTMTDVIPRLPRRKPLLVWLDYNSGISPEITGDVAGVVRIAAPGSIILVSINGDRRSVGEGPAGEANEVSAFKADLEPILRKYAGRPLGKDDLTRRGVIRLLASCLKNQLDEEAVRRGLAFWPLFGFSYSDGAEMVSVGGVIDTEEAGAALRASGVYALPFIWKGGEPVRIEVPPLTERERLWLMQTGRKKSGRHLRAEFGPGSLDSFQKYARYYPPYFESLT